MKRSQVFVTSALALSLGMAGLMPTVSTYAVGSTTCDAGDKHVDASLDPDFGTTMNNLNAANAGSVDITTDEHGRTVYKLQQNVCVDNAVGTANQGLVVSGDIVLDLNGHHIATDDAGARLINVGTKDGNTQGIISIVGAGTVAASQGIPVRVYGSMTDNQTVYGGVSLSNKAVLDGDDYGLMVGANSNKSAHGVSVVVDDSTIKGGQGGMFVHGNAQDGKVDVLIGNGSNILGGTDSGIYGAGRANWDIKDSNVSGYTGISAKSGTFNLTDTNVTGNGAKQTPDPANSNGMGETGAAIAVESNPAYAGGVEFTINGGTYTSEHNSTFLNYKNGNYTDETELNNFTVNYGVFKSADGEPVFTGFDDKAGENTLITGGSFSNNEGIDQFLPAGAEVVPDENGGFIVVRPDGMGSNGETANGGTITVNVADKKKDGAAAETPDNPNTGTVAKGEASAKSSTASIMAKIATVITTIGAGILYVRRRAQKRSHTA